MRLRERREGNLSFPWFAWVGFKLILLSVSTQAPLGIKSLSRKWRQLRLFIKWNFNWKKEVKQKQHTEDFKASNHNMSAPFLSACSTSECSRIAWILLGIYAPCYCHDRTPITNVYLACLSVSCRCDLLQLDTLMHCYSKEENVWTVVIF